MIRRSPASPQPGQPAGLRFLLVWLAALAFFGGSLTAHDFWIEPSDFTPRPGQPVALALRVGDHFVGDPVPRSGGRLTRFAILTPAGEQPVSGAEGVDPAGLFTPRQPGPHWVVLETRPRRLTLSGERFESYLMEEGLERIVALRAERGESDRPGRESYRRCAKSLLEVSGASANGGASAGAGGEEEGRTGCPLELLLESPPGTALEAGETVVRLLFDGGPLGGARVVALRRGDPGPALTARTGADGRVRLPLGGAGAWLLKAVHMEPAPAALEGVDWQSWWASLTVEIPAAAVATP